MCNDYHCRYYKTRLIPFSYPQESSRYVVRAIAILDRNKFSRVDISPVSHSRLKTARVVRVISEKKRLFQAALAYIRAIPHENELVTRYLLCVTPSYFTQRFVVLFAGSVKVLYFTRNRRHVHAGYAKSDQLTYFALFKVS